MAAERSPWRISAAMIVRDEERFLADCLASMSSEVDEIVIVDTGSVDGTKQIALNHGARVIDYPWAGDFAAARNCALDHATGDWILYIDADERLVVPRHGALREAVEGGGTIAFSVRFRPRVNATTYRELRVFRRDPRIRFRGVIHETVYTDIEIICRDEGLDVLPADVGLDHVGYEGNLDHKHRRNLPLLQAAVRDDPRRVYLWAQMGESLKALGRREEAEQACQKAIAIAASDPDLKQRADATLAWQYLIDLRLPDDPAGAIAMADRAVAAYPDNHALALIRASALVAAGGAAEILPILQALTAIDAETFADPVVAYDKRIFGEWAFDLMGAVYARLGQREAAAAAFGRAAALAPDNLGYRVKAAAFAPKPGLSPAAASATGV